MTHFRVIDLYATAAVSGLVRMSSHPPSFPPHPFPLTITLSNPLPPCPFRYEVQDLRVVDILPQMVALSESFFQVYELKGAQ